ncbi:1828_t:CDS:2 [Ambispora gerdemannii]|uniref:1828_t:CDS:1 n=1 Tax=Ambispora gerdemannii TaxID=144530 RepID=A0A9N9B9B3_9GLOM|nr:1828_t:CDS:2 [Ambispora gerdemannii]
MTQCKLFVLTLFAIVMLFNLTTAEKYHKNIDSLNFLAPSSSNTEESILKSIDLPQIWEVFEKVFERIYNNNKKNLFDTKHLQRGESYVVDIAVLPSKRKYTVTCERLKDRSYGQTYEIIFEPHDREENKRDYTIVIPFRGEFDANEGSNDDSNKLNSPFFAEQFSGKHYSKHHSDDYKESIAEIFDHIFHGKLFSDDLEGETRRRTREYEIAILPAYEKWRLTIKCKGITPYGPLYKITSSSEEVVEKHKFSFIVPDDDDEHRRRRRE